MLTLYTKSARKLSAAPARNAKLRLVGLAPRAVLVPRLPRVGLALRANLATPLPHASQIRTLNSVLCNLLCLRPAPTCFVIHLSTFAPATGRFAPLHLCTFARFSHLPLLRPPSSVLFPASHLSTFAQELCSDLHLCTVFVTHVLRTLYSVLCNLPCPCSSPSVRQLDDSLDIIDAQSP